MVWRRKFRVTALPGCGPGTPRRGPLATPARYPLRTSPLHEIVKDMIRVSRVVAAVSAMCAGLLIAGCSTSRRGTRCPPSTTRFRAGGLPAEDGPSGIRDDAPNRPETCRTPTAGHRQVDTAGRQRRRRFLEKTTAPRWPHVHPDRAPGVSYDSNDPSSPAVCGTETYRSPTRSTARAARSWRGTGP